MRIPIFLLTSLTVAACGGSPLDPGAGNSLGGGSHTLSLDGSIAASANLPNAGDEAAFTTHFDLRVQKDQVAVSAGSVVISSNGGDVTLVFDSADGGHWRGDQAGYYEVYGVDVTSGSDSITGVRVDGPDVHTFTSPALGATVDTTAPIMVTWSRGDHADLATLDTHNLQRVTIDDSGSYAMSAGAMKSSKDKAENDTIELRRTNQVAPAGATTGSTVSVSVRNAIDVVVAPNPGA
jgi:hypothetical protein